MSNLNIDDELNEKYIQQQSKKHQVNDVVDRIVPNIQQFTQEDVDDAICRLVDYLKLNNYDPETLQFMSERLSDISRKPNLFAMNISANSIWMDLCADPSLVDAFPGTYIEIARKYGIS